MKFDILILLTTGRLTLPYPYPGILRSTLIHAHNKCYLYLSLSSFDHDGLGRYGDPLNPDADIAAMKTVARVLNDHGLLILTIPIGKLVTELGIS